MCQHKSVSPQLGSPSDTGAGAQIASVGTGLGSEGLRICPSLGFASSAPKSSIWPAGLLLSAKSWR